MPAQNDDKATNTEENDAQNEQNFTHFDANCTQKEVTDILTDSIKPSEPSEPSASVESTTIVSVEEFFHDVADLPYQPLPEHSLEKSPCYRIIGRNNNNGLYFCRLHPECKNVNLESIEHHCKYKDLDYHKSERLKLLSTKSPDNELADPGGRIRVEGKHISSSIG